MSDLPSRGLVETYMQSTALRGVASVFIAILDSYASGRLVNRDIIDYEAVERVIREWNSYTPEAVTRFASELVAAMFGGSDEK